MFIFPATASDATRRKIEWTTPAVLTLLQHVKKHWPQLKDKFTKNMTVWKSIAAGVQQEMPDVNKDQCDQKWRNLVAQYKKYIDNQKKTGTGRMAKPQFFDEVGEIYGDSHAADPKFTFDTAAPPVPPTSSPSTSSGPSTASGPSSSAGPSSSTGPSSSAGPSTSADPGVDEAGEVSAQKSRKMKPSSVKERLEHKIDLLTEEQAAVRVQSDKQFQVMLNMLQKQHEEKQATMKMLVKSLSGAGKRKRKGEPQSESDSSCH